jgi:hypothetical protein
MSRALSKPHKDFTDFFLNHVRIRKQYGWIHIALQAHTIAYSAAGGGYIRGPIQTQSISSSFCKTLKPLATTFGEYDSWDYRTINLSCQRATYLSQIIS